MPPSTSPAFTKLVVHDLERMAAFYHEAYGLHAVQRVRDEKIADEPIDEIMLSTDPDAAYGSLVLLRFLPREAAASGEVILGFTTDDLDGLLERVRAAGGSLVGPVQELPERHVRVAFATDPEGHLAELVQIVP
jgi:predicted enzyme related to lactoylglutathione lyase